jgi:hypothetical protein
MSDETKESFPSPVMIMPKCQKLGQGMFFVENFTAKPACIAACQQLCKPGDPNFFCTGFKSDGTAIFNLENIPEGDRKDFISAQPCQNQQAPKIMEIPDLPCSCNSELPLTTISQEVQ